MKALIQRQLAGQTRQGSGTREVPRGVWRAPEDNQQAEYRAAFWLAWAHRGYDVPLATRIQAKRAATKLLADAEGSHWNPLDRRSGIYEAAADVLTPVASVSATARYAIQALSGDRPASAALTRTYDTAASAGGRAVDSARDFAVAQVDRAAGAVKRRAHHEAGKLARRAQAEIKRRVMIVARGLLLMSLLGVGVVGSFVVWRRTRRR